MLSTAITLVIIILIFANLTLKAYNYFYPPCENPNEYFSSAKNVDGLQSVSGDDFKYAGPSKPTIDEDGVFAIGRNSSNYSKKLNESTEKDIEDVVSAFFPVDAQEDSRTKQKVVSDPDGNLIAMFEEEFEGIGADNTHRNNSKKRIPHSEEAQSTQTDGYSQRRPNDW